MLRRKKGPAERRNHRLRKMKSAEKAIAIREKAESKVSKHTARKELKKTLKNLY